MYEATTSTEKEICWDERRDLWTLHGFRSEAIAKFDELVASIKEATGAERMVMALSSYGNRWRNEVMPSYKANRKATRKPLMYPVIREYVHEAYECFERPTLEGDDVLGILMTHPTLIPGEKVCVSIDKDLKTIPGKHYNYVKQTWLTVQEQEADYNHLCQAITGDTTDGYPGCPGSGPVAAAKLLEPFTSTSVETGGQFLVDVAGAWTVILAAYAKKGLGPDVALMNARVARICRSTEWNFEKKEVVLWQPPN